MYDRAGIGANLQKVCQYRTDRLMRRYTATALSKKVMPSRTMMPADAFSRNAFWGLDTQLKIWISYNFV